jgi:hypothetical protein
VTAGTPRRCPESARNISGFPAALEDWATCGRLGPSDLASSLATLRLALLYRVFHAGVMARAAVPGTFAVR